MEMISGLPISHFADYGRDPAIGPRPDQGEVDCCMECPHPRCPTDFNVEPQQRRCPLECYLDDCRREARNQSSSGLPENGYLTASQIARMTGVHVGSVIKRIPQGKYPGARKLRNRWLIPAGVAKAS